jgi:hypothetical protein
MAKQTVDELIASSDHGRIDEVRALRAAILDGVEGVTEQVKWNAPSFCVAGDDRVTFRLQPGDRVELVFHRGAKKRTDVDRFTFDDPTGRVVWSTPDRGVVAFADAADVRASLPVIVGLVDAWMRATGD